MPPNMKVIKRGGREEEVSFDKILRRLQQLATGTHKDGERFSHELDIDVTPISQQVIMQIRDRISTKELDEFAASTCANMVMEHPDYAEMAGRIIVSNQHKNTHSLIDTVKFLYQNKDKQGKPSPLIASNTYKTIIDNQKFFEELVDYNRDFLVDYFGFKTLERSYLLKSQSGHILIQERPQHMYLRVSVGIHGNDLEAVKETYELLSTQKLSHASPTLYNAGTPHPQLSSCFHEDTEVLTINEGVKRIKDVKIGDIVVTHTGKAKRVLQTHKNLQGDRKIFKLKCYKTKEIQVTGNHKFWSIKKNSSEPGWIPIEKLQADDLIAIPNYEGTIREEVLDILPYAERLSQEDQRIEYKVTDERIELRTIHKHSNLQHVGEVTVHSKSNSVNRYLKIDEKFAEFAGIFLGDGNIMTAKINTTSAKRKIRGLNFTFHEKNQKLIDFVRDTGREIFGVDAVFHKIKNQNVVQLTFSSTLIGYVFKELFGIHFDGKHIWSRINEWHNSLIDRFLAGLISTDGCVTGFSNYRLTNEIYHLLRNHGYDASFKKKEKRPNMGTCDYYSINILRDTSYLIHVKKYYEDDRMERVVSTPQSSSLVVGNHKFIKIKSLIETDMKYQYVYTLGVEDDHSYNVEGLVCENCFLLGMDDSLDGIYTCLKKCAMISKHAGGIGIWASEIRARGSRIRGTNGQSDGLIPMLRVFNETGRYVNQGGKRKGSIAVYLEPHHADIEDFLELKKTHGDQSRRALDLFLALWISDLFMKRLDQALSNKNDRSVLWSLFCPDEAPGLTDVYGGEYEQLYLQYEKEGRYRRQVPIIDLWGKVLVSQKETGVPYILYKDCVNLRNPQMNIGVVKSSNLCAEIVLTNSPKDETISVCNLCAIPLGSFVDLEKRSVDYESMARSVRVGIQNLNKIIDLNFYPVKDCANSNYRDRPVGMGVIGLYDVFCQLRYPFDSPEAAQLNRDIFECIYYHAVKTSMELAKVDGPYETFGGSPASQGLLQIDLWDKDRATYGHEPTKLSGRYNWDQLREDVKKYGMRNSTLVALMPTASSAQIIGQTESFECMTYNVYVRRVLSGDFKLVNKYLQRDLIERKLWTDELKEQLIAHRGSIQQLELPEDLKELYRTAFEVKQKTMLNLAVERSPFIDQTQSLNIFVSEPTDNILSSIQMYAFKNRLKTGQYYLRRETTAKAAQFTVKPPTTKDSWKSKKRKEKDQQRMAFGSSSSIGATGATGPSTVKLCMIDNPDCEACQV